MRVALRLAGLAGIVMVALLAGARASADAGTRTFCVERPISFDPLFRPSGCFTHKAAGDEMIVIGRALLDDQFLARGYIVEARLNEATCGSTTVSAANGLFELTIVGADSRSGCPTPGQEVTLYLSGVRARQTITWSPSHGADPEFKSLSVLRGVSWYWFERLTVPPPRAGTTVQALTNGVVCGETTVGAEDQAFGVHVREHLRGFMRLVVPQTNGDCGREGSLVEFRIGGLRAETTVHWEANLQRINLIVQGDANCDFLVDPRDATLMLQYSAHLTASVPCHGDADHSGRIDAFDAQRVLQFASGLSVALPA